MAKKEDGIFYQFGNLIGDMFKSEEEKRQEQKVIIDDPNAVGGKRTITAGQLEEERRLAAEKAKADQQRKDEIARVNREFDELQAQGIMTTDAEGNPILKENISSLFDTIASPYTEGQVGFSDESLANIQGKRDAVMDALNRNLGSINTNFGSGIDINQLALDAAGRVVAGGAGIQGDVNRVRDLSASRAGESEIALEQRGLLDLQESGAIDAATRDAAQARESAFSQLAQRGGLSSGARERLGSSSAEQAALARQGVRSQFDIAEQGVVASDAARKAALIQNLPGISQSAATTLANLEGSAFGLVSGAEQQTVNRQMAESDRALAKSQFEQNILNRDLSTQMNIEGVTKADQDRIKAAQQQGNLAKVQAIIDGINQKQKLGAARIVGGAQ